ncbi:kinesin-like protein KIF28 isoform X2 [Corticium candelabrum]|uniref:kinesin-like protein KIF28 isoform X2 n=1 Tax=Corticium candelabrum TaxID=121492 RepID=UPI002E26AB41|nr:kinesin-like protein KIF28 isoform X2 [Corticium candelabrum]
MTSESVKVAVRVRPFNAREKERNAKLVVEMEQNMTIIRDPDNEGAEPKKFAFDYSYWSHDGFHTDENGVFMPVTAKYADQSRVFKDLGQGVLDNAFQGFNCSLFAYGQTGSGKSYSMVGYGANKGIVPMTCDELFKTIEANKPTSSTKNAVTFSMLEIYNEQVRDLLNKTCPKGGLQVRQNPKLGLFYVQDLKRVPVGSYREIEKRMEEGTANRTVASTNMNATSSRAHTVVTIMFDQIVKNEAGQETKKSSMINLVDLAGSERADSTGATGDRLKEGANINKSLSSLGNVISALAEEAAGKKKVLVPYRDSILTKLLKNALGGNSKTVMIAALSPADINYDETLGTLRYADRAKKIKTRAVVNESPLDRLIRELRAENDKLKRQLDGGTLVMATGIDAKERERLRRELEEELKAQLAANQYMLGDLSESHDEKLRQTRIEYDAKQLEVLNQQKQRESQPHLVNLNEDPMLSGVVVHILNEGEMTVGRRNADPPPNLALSGLNIQKMHAVITVMGMEVTIRPCRDAKTVVNGRPLTGERVLEHKDRVLFGSGNHMYVFMNPKNTSQVDENVPDEITWEFAQKEIAEAKGFQTKVSTGLPRDQQIAQEQVIELLPLVSQVNAISEELNKHKAFEVIILSAAAQEGKGTKPKVMVKMKNLMNSNVWLWDVGKFMNRRFLIQDMYEKFLDNPEEMAAIKREEDPFWEPIEDILIGTANVFLQNLSFALDFDDIVAVRDYKGQQEGTLVVAVTPTNQSGKALLDEEAFVENSSELIGKPFHFKIFIRCAEIEKPRFSRGIRCSYFIRGRPESIQTELVKDTLTPEFNHSHLVTIDTMDTNTLEYFESGCITFSVYGLQEDTLPDQRLAKMTTKELRKMEHLQAGSSMSPMISRRVSNVQGDPNHDELLSQLKTENQTLQLKCERLQKKEKRIMDLLQQWEEKSPEDQDFHSFYRTIYAAIHGGSRFKLRAKLLKQMVSASKQVRLKSTSSTSSTTGADTDHANASNGQNVEQHVEGSKTCTVQ